MTIRKFYHMASGEMNTSLLGEKPADADLLSDLPDPGAKMGPWISEEDVSFYANEFKQSGFRGPLSYYRNMDLTWELTKDSPRQISQPALFVAGERDGVILMAADALKELDKHVTDLRVNKLIPKIGHWTQQEAPEEVNQALIQFLGEIG